MNTLYTSVKSRTLMLVLVLVLLLFVVPSVSAAPPNQTIPEPPSPVGVVDVIFITSLIAFLKVQFKLEGPIVVAVAGAVTLVVGLSGILAEQMPATAPWVLAVVGLLKLFVFSAGGYDLLTDLVPKMLGKSVTS